MWIIELVIAATVRRRNLIDTTELICPIPMWDVRRRVKSTGGKKIGTAEVKTREDRAGTDTQTIWRGSAVGR